MKTVAKAIVIDRDHKILVLRRSGTHPHFAYHLDFPGGEVEPGESEIDAVSREILEEIGIPIPRASLELVYQRQIPRGTLELVFVATLPNPRPKVNLSWEHDQYEWLTSEELLRRPLPQVVDSFYETALQYIRSRPAS